MKVTPRTFQTLWEAEERKTRDPKTGKPMPKSKPIFLQLTDVLESDVQRLEKAETKEEVKRILTKCMKIDEKEGFRNDILADMHYHNCCFCVSCQLSPTKTSCLLSIMKVVLEEAIAKRMVVEDAFQLFKMWMLKHGVQRPPKSVGIFSFEEIKKIMEYIHNTFFRHYRLYMYVYMTHCNMDFRAEDLDVGIVVPYSRPLPLPAEAELDPKDQPEFAHLFMPSEREQAELTLRNIRDRDKPEDRSAVIKREVDKGVQKLMAAFEQKLQDQDQRFKDLLEG